MATLLRPSYAQVPLFRGENPCLEPKKRSGRFLTQFSQFAMTLGQRLDPGLGPLGVLGLFDYQFWSSNGDDRA
jgi:hypothetical protein